jgi:hypothetical protein
MSQSSRPAGSRAVITLSRFVLGVWFVVAIVAGVFSLIGGVSGILDNFAGGRTPLTLVADKPLSALSGGVAAGGVPAGGVAATHLTSGNFPSASVSATGMPVFITVFALAAAIALIATEITLCALIALLAWRLLRGNGMFRRSLSITVIASGFVLTIGGILSQASVALAGGAAASVLNGGGNGFWPLAGRFDPTLAVVGVVLLLVGLAFEYGSRLQKETEGLI